MTIHKFSRTGLLICCLIIFVLQALGNDSMAADSTRSFTNQIELATINTKSNPRESYDSFTSALCFFRREADTVNIAKCLFGLSDIDKNGGKFNLAFDNMWEALILLNESQYTKQLIIAHRKIGQLYGLYQKDEESLDHLRVSLNLSRKLVAEIDLKPDVLLVSYYSLSARLSKSGRYDEALIYLDSCNTVIRINKRRALFLSQIISEKGNIFLKQGKLKKAENYLFSVRDSFAKGDSHYKIIYLSFLGELKHRQNDLDSAIYFYHESLATMNSLNAHLPLQSEILDKLSGLYQKKGNYSKAYYYLQENKIISDSLFSAKSSSNNELFEIKNRYMESVKEKDGFILKQNEIIESKNEIEFRLKLILGLIVVLVITMTVLIQLRLKIRKLNFEKKEAHLQQVLDKERSTAAMEIKQKELTAYALQMIDKDTVVDELLGVIKDEAPKIHKPLLTKVKKGNRNLWEEFNLRFTDVNTKFYDRLRAVHPDLTPTEQKHCALIKLKFDSKEMAKLLNISINSVHISRHRIRKKIGLVRENSLSNYISDI